MCIGREAKKLFHKVEKLNGRNKDLDTQKEILKDILNLSKDIDKILKVSHSELNNYYIGAAFL